MRTVACKECAPAGAGGPPVTRVTRVTGPDWSCSADVGGLKALGPLDDLKLDRVALGE